MENRVLEKKPSFSINEVFSGRFTSKYEKYITDNFPFRDFFVKSKSIADVSLLKKDNKGIYMGKDGYLIEEFKEPDMKIIDTNIEAINGFIKRNPNIPIYLMVAPNSVNIKEDKLPSFASSYDQKKVIDYINSRVKAIPVDVYRPLEEHKDEYVYYRTDHHWTTKGAYLAYREFCKSKGIVPMEPHDFDIKIVSDNFYGTFYSKFPLSFIKPDYIEAYYPKRKLLYKVDYIDTKRTKTDIYEKEYLLKKDKYSFFLDGNHSLLSIKAGDGMGKKLLVIKDSYAHCLAPFLLNHYGEVHMIDLRYYDSSVDEYIKENGIDEVLILYNTSFFSKDKSIKNLIYFR